MSGGMVTRSQNFRSATQNISMLHEGLAEPPSRRTTSTSLADFIMISSDGPTVEDGRPRARTVELGGPETIRTKEPVLPKRNLQLLLQAPSNELEKWTPSDRETMRILQCRSSSKKQEGWTYAELAGFVNELATKKQEREKHIEQVVLSRDEMACLDMEIQQGIEHKKDAERAFGSYKSYWMRTTSCDTMLLTWSNRSRKRKSMTMKIAHCLMIWRSYETIMKRYRTRSTSYRPQSSRCRMRKTQSMCGC